MTSEPATSTACDPNEELTSEPKAFFNVGLQDISEAIKAYRIALIFGWQDIAQRYRRSRVGAFWLTFNMAVYIGALGFIFGVLFRSNIETYLPHLCAGVIVWGLISSCLQEGCSTFSNSSGIILHVRLPLFVHVMRVLWKNVVIFFHNILIFPFVGLFLGLKVNLNLLFVVPGFILVCLNIGWIMLALATVCCRFRDITQVITNILQILFYLTPIIWMVQTLPENTSLWMIELNPLYHLLELIRAPLLGKSPELLSWLVSCGLAAIGWTFAIVFFGKYRRRIPYWL